MLERFTWFRQSASRWEATVARCIDPWQAEGLPPT
jgi:hypothetical protein